VSRPFVIQVGRWPWQGIVAVEVYRVRIMSHVGGVTVLSPIVLRRARTGQIRVGLGRTEDRKAATCVERHFLPL
jgi:hypothetical protein